MGRSENKGFLLVYCAELGPECFSPDFAIFLLVCSFSHSLSLSLRFIYVANIAVYQVKLPPATLTSHMGAGLRPDCSTSNYSICAAEVSTAPLPAQLLLTTWKSSGGCPKYLSSYTYVGALDETPKFLASAWPSTAWCPHLGSDPTDRRFSLISLSLLLYVPL